MRELDGADDVLFRDFLRAGLDHHDTVLGADDHDVDGACGALRVGRVDDELAVNHSDAHRAHGAVERDVGQRERAAGTVDAEHVGIVFLVGGVDERDHLGLVAEGLGEQRTNGPVDLAGGKDFLLRRPTFALDEAAGDASAGIRELAVLDGEREEVDAFLGVGRGDRGAKDGVVAGSGERGTRGLLGHASGFKLDVLAAGKLYGYVLLHRSEPLLSVVVGNAGCAA